MLAYQFPSATLGSPLTGEKVVYISWWEKRSSNYQYWADKSSRIVGKGGDGESAQATGILGQSWTGDGSDSIFADEAAKWPANTSAFFEVMYVLSDVSVSNGKIYYWKDNVLVGQHENILLIEDSRTVRFQQVRFGGWESGAGSGMPGIINRKGRFLQESAFLLGGQKTLLKRLRGISEKSAILHNYFNNKKLLTIGS